MAQKNRTTLKSYFETGDKPTESQFEDLIDSFVSHQDDSFVSSLPNATTSQKGIAEQATLAEVNAGTDDSRFVTAKGAKQAAIIHAPVLSVNGQTGNITVGHDSGWQSASLINGFVHYGGAYEPARYRRKNGVVYLQGLIKGGTAGSPIFHLPSDFRPSKRLIFAIIGNGNIARIDIDVNGVVIASVHYPQFMSLSGISFVVD